MNPKITNSSLYCLTNLTRLNLCGNKQDGLTNESVKKLVNLRELDLSQQYSQSRPQSTVTDDGISQLTNLTVLNLDRTFTITDQGVSLLTNLTELIVTYNKSISDESMWQFRSRFFFFDRVLFLLTTFYTS
jgi:Leucine-rich repeat (LRR) protein